MKEKQIVCLLVPLKLGMMRRDAAIRATRPTTTAALRHSGRDYLDNSALLLRRLDRHPPGTRGQFVDD
jgi:hypothetical protein